MVSARKSKSKSQRARTSQVRIIAGQWKGRRLPVIDEQGLRPTTDRLRETLFNWQQPEIEGLRCLDLFAGTGILGIEALSRGASWVDFVDSSGAVVQSITESLTKLEAESRTGVFHADASRYLKHQAQGLYDLVFIDPPYDLELQQSIMDFLQCSDLLSEDALVVIESRARQEIDLNPSYWQQWKLLETKNVRLLVIVSVTDKE